MPESTQGQGMHEPTADDRTAAADIAAWAVDRLANRREMFPPATPWPRLPALPGEGIGTKATMRLLRDDMFPTALVADHPRYLSFVPIAPSVAAVLADMALAAACVYGGSRVEEASAAEAEEAALRWLTDAAGLPASAGGTFVSGGSIANLSALVAARGDRYDAPRRQAIVVGASAHASVAAAARVMGCDLVVAEPADEYGRLDAPGLEAALAGRAPEDIVAVVATAGATNNGAIDDLAWVAEVCHRASVWLHVDAAYGGAALLSPRTRPLFDGIEQADSLTIDPHKWLFTPFDCAAVIYRDRTAAAQALTQRADYLDVVHDESGGNPADLAIHLTRRARGVPLWAALMAYGTNAFQEAIDACLDVAGYAAEAVSRHPRLQVVVPPRLSVVVFRRPGWGPAEYTAWSAEAVRSGLAVVLPTRHDGETVLRFCFVNPLTTPADVDLVLASFD